MKLKQLKPHWITFELMLDKRFKEIYDNIMKVANISDTESVPRTCGRQTVRTNISTNDPVVYYRQSVFIPFLDNGIQRLEERFSPSHSAVALASKWVPSVMLKNPEALSSDQLSMTADAFPDLPSTRGLQSEYERWWVKWHEDKDIGGTISNFVDSLHWQTLIYI